MRKHISQREARRLQKRVAALKEQERVRMSRYRAEYPGGVHILTLGLDAEGRGRLYGASVMGAAFVAKLDGSEVRIYAIPAGAS